MTTYTSYTTKTLTDTTTTTETTAETSHTTNVSYSTDIDYTTSTDVDYTTQTSTHVDYITTTSLEVDTTLTTDETSVTWYYETTATILTTQPVLTHLTVVSTIPDIEESTTVIVDYTTIPIIEVSTALTTNVFSSTYVTSRTSSILLTSRTTFETTETIPTAQPPAPPSEALSSEASAPSEPPAPPSVPLSSEASAPSEPPAFSQPPSSNNSPSPAPTTSPPSASAPITAPPPPPPPNPCTNPPYNEFFGVTWLGYRPVPGAEPLKTVYRTVYTDVNVTVTSTFCNTPAFERYYRTNLCNCAKGCGPFQTVDNSCNIVIGPVFTGTGCDGPGYKITQTGPSGNNVYLGTSIIGHGLTIDGTCVPITSTSLQTPLIYTGDVIPVDNPATLLERRQAPSPQRILILSDFTAGSISHFSQASEAVANGADETSSLPGADSLTPPAVTRAGSPAAQEANQPTESAGPQPSSAPAAPSPTAGTAASSPATASPAASAPASGSAPGGAGAVSPTTPTTSPSGTGFQGSASFFSSGDASLGQLTCVPLSLVVPTSASSSAAGDSASASSSGAAAASQSGNAALREVGWGWWVFAWWFGMGVVV